MTESLLCTKVLLAVSLLTGSIKSPTVCHIGHYSKDYNIIVIDDDDDDPYLHMVFPVS